MDMSAADLLNVGHVLTLLGLGKAAEAAETLLECFRLEHGGPEVIVRFLCQLTEQHPVHSFQVGRVGQLIRTHPVQTPGWPDQCHQALQGAIDSAVDNACNALSPAEQKQAFAMLHMLAIACIDLQQVLLSTAEQKQLPSRILLERSWKTRWLPKLAAGGHGALQALLVTCDALAPVSSGATTRAIEQAMNNAHLCNALRLSFKHLECCCGRGKGVSGDGQPRDRQLEALLGDEEVAHELPPCEVHLRETVLHQLDHMLPERSLSEYVQHELRWRLSRRTTRGWLFWHLAQKITSGGGSSQHMTLLWQLRELCREDYHHFFISWVAKKSAVLRGQRLPVIQLREKLSAILGVCDLPVTITTVTDMIEQSLSFETPSPEDQCSWLVAILGLEVLREIVHPQRVQQSHTADKTLEDERLWWCNDRVRISDIGLSTIRLGQSGVMQGELEAWNSSPLFSCVSAALGWLALHTQHMAGATMCQSEGPSFASLIPVERLEPEVRKLAQELLPSLGNHVSRDCQAHLQLLQGLLVTYSYPLLLLPCCIPDRWMQLNEDILPIIVLHLGSLVHLPGLVCGDVPPLLHWKPKLPEELGTLRLVCKEWRRALDAGVQDLYVTSTGLVQPPFSRLKNLKGVHVLFDDDNDDNDSARESLASLCLLSPKLATLALHEDRRPLPSDAYAVLPTLTPHLSGLRRLALRSTQTRARDMQTDEVSLQSLLRSVSTLSQLEELDLSGNQLVSMPSEAVCRLSKLTKLVLSHNRLRLPLRLDALSGSLQDLRLGPGLPAEAFFKGKGLASVVVLTQLRLLDLSAVWTSWDQARLSFHLTSLNRLSSLGSTLTGLDISHFNQQTWPGVLSHLTRLQQLNMQGHCMLTIPETILALKDLQHLDVTEVTEEPILRIPRGLTGLTNLRRLMVSVDRGSEAEKMLRANGVIVSREQGQSPWHKPAFVPMPKFPISMQPQYEGTEDPEDVLNEWRRDASADDNGSSDDNDDGEDDADWPDEGDDFDME